jgi:hypothetical protein
MVARSCARCMQLGAQAGLAAGASIWVSFAALQKPK